MGALLWRAMGENQEEHLCIAFDGRLLRLDWIHNADEVSKYASLDPVVRLVARHAGVASLRLSGASQEIVKPISPQMTVLCAMARQALDGRHLEAAKKFLTSAEGSVRGSHESAIDKVRLALLRAEIQEVAGENPDPTVVIKRLDPLLRKLKQDSDGHAKSLQIAARGLGDIGDRCRALERPEAARNWYRAAMNYYDRAVKKGPSDGAFWLAASVDTHSLAKIEKRSGHSEQAQALLGEACRRYEKAAEIKPDMDEVFNNWGNALFDQAQLKGATPEADRLFQEAGLKYAEAVRIKPDSGAPHYNLACLEALLGNVPDCCASLRRWQEVDPKANQAKVQADSDFDRVRTAPEFQTLIKSLPP